jgi:hypothetical protein
MASKRASRRPQDSPEGWIRVVFVRSVPPSQELRLRLKPRAGKAPSIEVAYVATKKTLRRGKR